LTKTYASSELLIIENVLLPWVTQHQCLMPLSNEVRRVLAGMGFGSDPSLGSLQNRVYMKNIQDMEIVVRILLTTCIVAAAATQSK